MMIRFAISLTLSILLSAMAGGDCPSQRPACYPVRTEKVVVAADPVVFVATTPVVPTALVLVPTYTYQAPTPFLPPQGQGYGQPQAQQQYQQPMGQPQTYPTSAGANSEPVAEDDGQGTGASNHAGFNRAVTLQSLLQAKCARCHQPGGSSGVEFLTQSGDVAPGYDALDILKPVRAGRMPPRGGMPEQEREELGAAAMRTKAAP